jgi:hypothetical protein
VNACKTQGECAVPLSEDTWKKVREKFAAEYKKQNEGKELGAAPPAKG